MFLQLGRIRNRESSLSMVLTPSELRDGTWQINSQIVLRAEKFRKEDDIATRARKLRCPTVITLFETGDKSQRVSIRLSELASSQDAEVRQEEWSDYAESSVKNFDRSIEVLRIRRIFVGNQNNVEEDQDLVPALQYPTDQGMTNGYFFKAAAWHYKNYFFTVSRASKFVDMEWSEVTSILKLQQAKLRHALPTSGT